MLVGFEVTIQTIEPLFDEDGWFHTGDFGTKDIEGFLYLQDSKENMISLDNGKQLAPSPLEEALRGFPLVDEGVIVGTGRPYIVALLSLNPYLLNKVAKEKRVQYDDVEKAKPTEVAIQKFVAKWNSIYSKGNVIERFQIVDGGFKVEKGEVSLNGRICRSKILSNHKANIEEMYKEDR